MQQLADQIRWLVPTDRIDAFIPLWEAETGRRAAERDYATNHAPADAIDLAALEAAIRTRPALFALDSVLYQYARSRHADWAAGVQQRIAPWDHPANASRVYHGEGGGVWLRRGWYPSEQTHHGPGNWAGPTQRSDIAVRRGAGQNALVFDVMVVNGITFTDITAFASDSFTELPVAREELTSELWRYRIDLSGLPRTCEIALMVPDCYAPINVFADDVDAGLERRSFLAAGWGLTLCETDRHSRVVPLTAPLPDTGEPDADGVWRKESLSHR